MIDNTVVSEDLVILPVKPTPQMLDEIRLTGHFSDRALVARYNALLASAPKPPYIMVLSGVWQFYQDGEWNTGMNTLNHRANTEAAGFIVRDLWVKQELNHD